MKLIRTVIFSVISLLSQVVYSQNNLFEITPILVNKPIERAYNIVVLSEGFTESEISNFILHCREIPEVLAVNSVYADVLDSINVYAISTVSNDNGITLLSRNPQSHDPIQSDNIKDTYFGIYYQNSYRAYFFGDNTIFKAVQVAVSHIPYTDAIHILVNGDRKNSRIPLSGRANSSYPLNASVSGVYNRSNNDRIFEDFFERYLFLHELSHAIGGLADEYVPNPSEGFNITTNNDSLTIRWKNLLGRDNVGIYPGRGSNYLPYSICLMNQIYNEDMCGVCRDRMKKSITIRRQDKLFTPHRLNFESTSANSIVSLSWDAIEDADNYEVVLKGWLSDGITRFVEVLPINDTSTSFDNNAISLAIIKLRAYNDNYSSVFISFDYLSSYFSGKYSYLYSRDINYSNSQPANISTALTLDNRGVILSWNKNEDNESSFIRLFENGERINEFIISTDSIILNNLNPLSDYSFQVAVAKLKFSEETSILTRFSDEISLPTIINPLFTVNFAENDNLIFRWNPEDIPLNTYIEITIKNLDESFVRRDIIGREFSNAFGYTMPLRNVPEGSYIVNLKNNSGFDESVRLIKR